MQTLLRWSCLLIPLFISLLSWYTYFCKRFLEIHLKFWLICQISPLESYSFIFPRNVMSICPNHLLWFIYFFHFANPHNNDISVLSCISVIEWGSFYVFSHLLLFSDTLLYRLYNFIQLAYCINFFMYPFSVTCEKFLKFIFNWRITALQCCIGFCHITKWISQTYTRVPPFWISLPPH